MGSELIITEYVIIGWFIVCLVIFMEGIIGSIIGYRGAIDSLGGGAAIGVFLGTVPIFFTSALIELLLRFLF